MLSFRRFVSVFEEYCRESFPYKDIYSFRGTNCILWTNSKKHADWVSVYFQYYYHYERDHRDILKLQDEDCFYLYSYVDQQSYLRIFEWIEEILLLRVGYFYDDIAEITFSDGGIVVDRKKKMILSYHQSLKQIYLVSDGSQSLVQNEITRIIREIMTRAMEKKGFFLFHASVVEKDGKAVLFSGESGAGKTSILLGLLDKGYHFLSDDRVLIGVENRKVKAIAWPGPIGITLATTMQFEPLIEIYADLGSLTFPQHRIHSLALDKLEENEIDRVDLSVEELVTSFQTKFVREAELEQIFLLDDYPPDQLFKPIDYSPQLIESLKQRFFFPHENSRDPAFCPWFHRLNKDSAKLMSTYDLTVKIIARLTSIRRLSKERIQKIEEKVEQIANQI